MTETFAQHMINKALPAGIKVHKAVDANELKALLTKVYKEYPDRYDEVVTKIKYLGDIFSTYEGITMGIKEIDVPNKEERDKIIATARKELDKAKSDDHKMEILDKTQKAIIANDVKNRQDSATMLVKDSRAIKSKNIQLVKLRSSPVVVAGLGDKPIPELFDKSYAEGQTPYHQWLQSVDARSKVAEGQTQTSSPGELSKILHNVLAPSVISMDDCHTKHGVYLPTHDDIIGRYFAQPIPTPYTENTEVTPQIQKDLLARDIDHVSVRSPQTCSAPAGTVCSKCAGLSISTGKKHEVGINLGYITAGNMAEPLTQMTLSSKHSSTMAKTDTSLRGDKGFRQFVEMPKEFSNQKIFAEVDGTVWNIAQAPQGGKLIYINPTKPVQQRFVSYGQQDPKTKQYVYFIPPNRTILKEIKPKADVHVGQPLTDGVNNLKDIARFQGLGRTRTLAAEGMRDIYKNTNSSIDRRHFELLSRAGHGHIEILKVPKNFPYKRGEVVDYPEFQKAIFKVDKQTIPVEQALYKTMTDQINDVTAGTYITKPVMEHLQSMGVTKVNVTDEIEVAPSVTALTRVLDRSPDWLAIMNHRRLKENIINAAATGKKSNIHGWNPVPGYMSGEIGETGEQGQY